MSRLMSVAYTEQAVIERRKTVTRRKGWVFLKPGDRLTLCRKVMGRKPGEPLVRLAEVEVIDVRREPLDWCIRHDEVEREGFPGMPHTEFMSRFFTDVQGIQPRDLVTRIEWRYLDTREEACLRTSGCDGISHSLSCNDAWFAVDRGAA